MRKCRNFGKKSVGKEENEGFKTTEKEVRNRRAGGRNRPRET